MSTPTRRQFFHSALAAGTGLALAARPAPAIEPIRRTGKSHLRLSLAAYSFNRYLNLKRQPKPEMTLDDVIDFAAAQNIDAVELTAYYFPRTTPDYLAHLKGRATRLGLDVSGTAIGNNFCVRSAEGQKKQMQYVKDWVEHSARLGAKTVRIFAGNVEKGDTEEQARARCVGAIQEACDFAAKYGLYLALENHGGIVATIDQMLAVVRAVKHPWFGVNFDTGNFVSPDPYADLVRLAPYAVTVQIKTEVHRSRPKRTEEADLKKLTDILRSAGYRGYIALEYEAREDPRSGVPRALAALKKLMG